MLILPPPPSDYFSQYTFVNLKDFSEKIISVDVYNFSDEPMIIHKFKGKKYLQCQSAGFDYLGKKTKFSIIEEKGEGNFIIIEELSNDNILGDNLLFFDYNSILSWNYGENNIKFLKY